MRTEAMVSLACLAVAACDGERLLAPDAGVFHDAGFFDPRDSGNEGEPDAGEPTVDAGLPDAGPCNVDTEPVELWDCEPDVDWCDPRGDWPVGVAAIPSSDLLGTWSRFDGADFILQLRFSTRPFRSDVGMAVTVLFAESPLAPDGPDQIAEDREDAATFLVGATTFGIAQVHDPNTPFAFPPSDFGGNTAFRSDGCNVFLDDHAPVLEIRFDRNLVDPNPRYAISIQADESGRLNEVSWDGDPVFLSSNGGQSDTEILTTSTCNQVCERGD